MIYACVVTYNPEEDRLEKNIASLKQQAALKGVIIVDNGSANVQNVIKIATQYDCNLIQLGENLGIAKALNVGVSKAIDFGAEWVLTCDQDSVLPPNLISAFEKYLYLEKCAILCPKIYDANAKVLVDQTDKKENVVSVNRCITSGSLMKVSCWQELGGFDEFLFIDGVDFDFCDRLKKKGFNIYRINEVELNHSIGNMCVKHIGPIKFLVLNHSAFRKYYILRNRIYCDYKMSGRHSLQTFLAILKQILLIACYETEKKAKLKAAFRGVKDGVWQCRKLKEAVNG